MGRIPERSIEEIRDRVDIVDLVSRHVTLRQAGRNFKGLCPFHEEKTPSFNVNRDRQIYHCFGCGEGGNVFTFLMKREGLTFVEAARQLAQDHGIEIPDDDRSARDAARTLYDANVVAQQLYRRVLLSSEGEAARAYLAKRGLDAAAVERFGIGFAPDRWDAVARALGDARIGGEAGERAGLLARRDSGGFYDRLRARVTFPIHDVRGRVIGFGGRATKAGQEPKYLNTPETAVFRKRESLYGLHEALEAARRRDRLVVVEGYFDRVALARAGVVESVATCGTALSRDHAKQLRRRAREAVLLFDGDAAGQRAIAGALQELLPEGLRVLAAMLPEGDDPDTYLEREGAQALLALVDSARPALELVIERAIAKGVATPFDKSDAVAAVAPLLARVADAVERSDWTRRLALGVGVEPRAVDAAVRAAFSGGDAALEPEARAAAVITTRTEASGPLERALRSLARLLLQHPELAPRVRADEWMVEASLGSHGALIAAILDQAELGEPVKASALVDRLDAASRDLLLGLAVDDVPLLSPEEADRALADTLREIDRRRLRHEGRSLTERLRTPAAGDVDALIAEKQRQLERRRAALGLGPPAMR